MTAALKIDQLSLSYDHTPVLWDISLSIPKGTLGGILGPNGAGKSSLIKACMGLTTPLSGEVLFFGQRLEKMRKKIGYVPQRESVDWDFPITVLELVLMGCYGALGPLRWPSKENKKEAIACLEKVGMQAYAQRQISQLSGGQQQRVFLARALLQKAELYFLDEPFSGIDAQTEQIVMQLLDSLVQEGKTVLVVHHDLSSVKKYFDFVIMLNMRLVAAGPTGSTFTQENLELTYGRFPEFFDEATKGM